MPLQIIVTAKQVIDPEIPKSAFKIDAASKRVSVPASFPPVVNGFDEHAVEAALRIKDTQEAKVTVVAVGKTFSIDVMRKLLAMGADELVLVQDPAIDDSHRQPRHGPAPRRCHQEDRRLRPATLRPSGL